MSCLPLLPDDIFYTFDKAEFHEITQHMIPRITKDFSYIKGKPQAIPFDIGLDMMVYRKDLFEDPLLKRMYYEQSGKMLEVPSTFEQYEQVVRFFDRESNPHSPVQCGTGMNWDSPVELSSSFFLRYINFVKDHKFKRGKTRIEEDAVLKALENIYVCGQHALPVQGKQWVGATLDNFISGQTAVEFVFLNYASNIAHLQKSSTAAKSAAPMCRVGYHILPAAHFLFSTARPTFPPQENSFTGYRPIRRQNYSLFTVVYPLMQRFIKKARF